MTEIWTERTIARTIGNVKFGGHYLACTTLRKIKHHERAMKIFEKIVSQTCF